MAGKSSYKIKYFGFDDLSESDSDEESPKAKEKKAKKAAAALAALSSSVDSPHTSDSQDSQASSNTGELIFNLERQSHLNHSGPIHSHIDACALVSATDAFDFADDSSPCGTEGQKGRSGKPSDKSKDVGSGFKKIFSGPKKVIEHAWHFLCLSLPALTLDNFYHHTCPVPRSDTTWLWKRIPSNLTEFKWHLHNRITSLTKNSLR